MTIQLLTRPGCHLCEMARALVEEDGLSFQLVDVDADAELADLYGFRIPVLLVDGRPVAEGRLTAEGLRRALATRG